MSFYLYPPVQTVSASSPLKFVLDSVTVDVNEDTVTPANNKPLPVKLVDLSGNINITAGDLSVQLDSVDPVNYDSTRVGDGTNLLGINASNEALVHDADILAELILQKAVLNLTATAAKQDTAQARFDLLATEARQITLQTRADLLATEASLLALSSKLPASLGIKADAASLSVTQSTEDRVISNAIKTAVEALADVVNTTESYYKRDFSSSPLTVASSWVGLRILTADVKRINITNNSGNELLVRHSILDKKIIIGQGAVFRAPLIGLAGNTFQISAIGTDAVDGIIYINFEG